jgi:hypothetical protein
MAEKSKEPKRLNRVVGVAEAISGALDPALKRRGFATRDIVTQWAAIAPSPYDKVAMPDKLVWPRGEKSAEGAVLYLRCMPAHTLALSHEGARIAAAVNRYFGYLLVREVRLSAEPFVPENSVKSAAPRQHDRAVLEKVETAIEAVEDSEIREALRQLGRGLMDRKKKG